MTARNDITGDLIKSATSKKYTANYDGIKFGDNTKNTLVIHRCTDGLKKTTIAGNKCKTCDVVYNE